MSNSPNHFVWYELLTTNREAAEAFYRAVIGWTSQDSGHPEMPYTIMSAGDRPVSGVMTLPPEICEQGGRPGWIGYVSVEDVDAATHRLKEAGGAVHREPDDIPNVGRFSVVADPQGANFVLFQPRGEEAPPPPMGTPGHIGWRELYAADGASAFDFYAGQFGWTKAEAMDMGPMGVYQLFAAGDDTIGGMMTKPEQIPAPFWLFNINVPELDAAVERVNANGGQILFGPEEVPGGAWIVQGMDPQGAMFALVAMRR
ncbi:MAG: glyoxalase [Microvirga sp.]|nr:glyoxalase [Microvirga sp.]